MSRPRLSYDQGEELQLLGVPAAPDVRMLSDWRLSVAGVPVPPVPEVGSTNYLRAIYLYRSRLSPEVRAQPRYAVDSPAWPGLLREEHAARMAAYDGPWTPVRFNIRRRHELWDGKTYEEVVAPFRARATRNRGSAPPPAAPPAAPPAPAVDAQPPPAVEVPPQQMLLAQEGDPADVPGLLAVLAASEEEAAWAAAEEAADEAAAVEAVAALEDEDEDAPVDDIDWERLEQSTDDDGDDGAGAAADGGAVDDVDVIDLDASDEE